MVGYHLTVYDTTRMSYLTNASLFGRHYSTANAGCWICEDDLEGTTLDMFLLRVRQDKTR
ncbi:uncharacterized protein FOMMEDRAFT_135559 [Fomitiporia mediterranea MF3/22]|uniref:uncharacterized protein n=1 Tax=Fomitiporia mediterranea (strain MF3/22) TaxID=694068 RepID=UPI0004407908|nr:uncharacterized protein FOMMEDRAFT_135559 [Fomitiporia mediterranea MF3/22]EJD01325.1 hypothetical protein FOMMEDRAFT_135559 [Fomitiporia mediterranea MF3/22]